MHVINSSLVVGDEKSRKIGTNQNNIGHIQGMCAQIMTLQCWKMGWKAKSNNKKPTAHPSHIYQKLKLNTS